MQRSQNVLKLDLSPLLVGLLLLQMAILMDAVKTM